jgi:hypothetical protein
MGFGNGKKRGGLGSGLGGSAPGCCTRKVKGKPAARGLNRPKPKLGTTRRGLGAGRGFGRGNGFKK